MSNKNLDIFHNFFSSNQHLLEKGDNDWSTDRILFQLAYEDAVDSSSISKQANDFYCNRRVDWEWMKCLFATNTHNISEHLQHATQIQCHNNKIISSSKDGNICIWNLKECTNPIKIISIFSRDYQQIGLPESQKKSMSRVERNNYVKLMMREEVLRFLIIDEINLITWSNDVNLFLVDINTDSCKMLSGHSDSILGVEKISSTSVLSWSFDNTLRLWDLASGDSKVLEGHTDWIDFLKVLNEKSVITYSKDNTLRLWDLTSGDSKVLEGHTGWINGLKVLNEENVITYSKDNTLRLWDLASGDSKVLEGHTDSVLGLEFIDTNKIISWSDDNSLKIWNLNSLEYYNLGNHKNIIKGVRLIGKTSVLSWSWDKTICLWETNTKALITKYIFPGVDKLIINDDLYFCIGMNGTTRMLKKIGN